MRKEPCVLWADGSAHAERAPTPPHTATRNAVSIGQGLVLDQRDPLRPLLWSYPIDPDMASRVVGGPAGPAPSAMEITQAQAGFLAGLMRARG